MSAVFRRQRRQRGITMAISLILLTLVTILIVTAMYLSTANLKSVANMEFRDQAVSAANAQIEALVSSNFSTAQITLEDQAVDVDEDGITDALVDVEAECIQATIAATAPQSSLSLPVSLSKSPTWNVTYDIRATADDPATGASVTVRSGVRVLVSDDLKKTVCE